MTTLSENIQAACAVISSPEYKKQIGKGVSYPLAQQLLESLKKIERNIQDRGLLPSDWKAKSSIGTGLIATIPWIAFLPPGQKPTKGIYLALCFGKAGNGLVAGCALSSSSRDDYKYIRTVEREHPAIDVNGHGGGTHYNNVFVNPLEVYAERVDENALFEHIQKSVEQCQKCLAGNNMDGDVQREVCEPLQDKAKSESPIVNASPRKFAGKRKALSFHPDSKDDAFLCRLLAALRAKPFVILAGHSGTGKSRYAKKLAYMTCNAEELRKKGKLPGNYLLLQVRPNWHDSTDLLGYRNAMDGNRQQKTALVEFLFKAMHYRETPFFLCLDEMNLAPVEQYFAEFLSAMESKEPVPLNDITAAEDNLVELGCEWVDAKEALEKRGFAIPENLFIVGTVNMDETTNQFSRKVLDRAFTIEMTDVDFRNFGKVEEPGYGDTLEEETIQALLAGRGEVVQTLDGEDTADGAALVRVQKALEDSAFAIAYRFASEYTLLKRAIAVFDPEGRMGLDALDQAVLMKILPRVAGERDYIERVYGKGENEGLRKALEGKAVSLAKIGSILKRAEDTDAQYVTFWP